MELKNIEAAALLKAQLDEVNKVNTAMNPTYQHHGRGNSEPRYQIAFTDSFGTDSIACVRRITIERAIELERAALTEQLKSLGVTI